MPRVCSCCWHSGRAPAARVLVNDKGECITCAGTSAGLISTIVENSRFERCVEDAKAKGYRIER